MNTLFHQHLVAFSGTLVHLHDPPSCRILKLSQTQPCLETGRVRTTMLTVKLYGEASQGMMDLPLQVGGSYLVGGVLKHNRSRDLHLHAHELVPFAGSEAVNQIQVTGRVLAKPRLGRTGEGVHVTSWGMELEHNTRLKVVQYGDHAEVPGALDTLRVTGKLAADPPRIPGRHFRILLEASEWSTQQQHWPVLPQVLPSWGSL